MSSDDEKSEQKEEDVKSEAKNSPEEVKLEKEKL